MLVTSRKLKLILGFGVVGALCVFFWLFNLPLLFRAPPSLIIDSRHFELGMVEPGTHEFRVPIRNGGGSPLVLLDIRATCGCAFITKCEPIPAGDTGIITGKVSIRPGRGASTVLLVSNAPEAKHLIELRWFGKRVPLLIPSLLEVSGRPNQEIRRDLSVVYAAGEKLEVSGLSNSKVCRSWRIDPDASGPIEVPKNAYTETLGISLALVSPGEEGEHVIETRFRCKQGALNYEIPLLLRFDVRGPMYSKPHRIFVGGSSVEDLVGRKFRATVIVEGKSNPISVESKPEFVECKLEQVAEEYFLHGTIKSPPPQGLSEFRIVLRNTVGDSCVLMANLLVGKSADAGQRP
jgi:hypothetical protein